MKSILEFLMIGILFMIGTIVISTIQLILWLWEGLIQIKNYFTKK